MKYHSSRKKIYRRRRIKASRREKRPNAHRASLLKFLSNTLSMCGMRNKFIILRTKQHCIIHISTMDGLVANCLGTSTAASQQNAFRGTMANATRLQM